MFDERAHPGKGGLKGREPIGRFFRDIEGYLHKFRNSSPLCWKPPSYQCQPTADSVGSTHIDRDPSFSERLWSLSGVAFETWYRFRRCSRMWLKGVVVFCGRRDSHEAGYRGIWRRFMREQIRPPLCTNAMAVTQIKEALARATKNELPYVLHM